MNRWQKIAWFELIVIVVGFVVSIITASTLPPEERLIPPNRVSVVIILTFVLIGMSKAFFRKPSDGVDLDERDKLIHHKAIYSGWIAFALSVLAGVMICYVSAIGPKGVFSPFVLPVIAVIGGGIYVIVASITALILYGRSGKNIDIVSETGEVS